MRRAVLIVFILAVVIGVSIWGYGAFSGEKAAKLPEGIETGEVMRGDITALVSATGSIAPEARTSVVFRASGEVREVLVERGDQVKKGQVLARLDVRVQEIAAAQAELAMRISELQLARLETDPSEEDLVAALASEASAEEGLNVLLEGPTEREVELAKLSVDQARNSLWSAQANRDSTAGSPMSSAGAIASAEGSVANAEIALRLAEIQYEKTLEGASEQAIKAAETQLAQARASLSKLREGPSAEDLATSRLQVEQSRLSLESALLRLEDATITAPFDAIVVDVGLREGEMASSSGPSIILVDMSRFHTDVFIDELDIGRVEVGQGVSLELDAFPGEELEGEVAHIDAMGTASQGLVTYKVTIDLGNPSLAIKPDMTVSVRIVVAEREDVLLVPRQAVRRDAEGKYVEMLEGADLRRISVEVGLSDEGYTEIVSGLNEGDEIVIKKPRANVFQMAGG